MWKKAVLNAAEERRNSQIGPDDSDGDFQCPVPNERAGSSQNEPSGNVGHSGYGNQCEDENSDSRNNAIKKNCNGHVKTQRYTKRVKPPLPKQMKKKGSVKPTRASSRLAEKRKIEVI
ncbi:MAG: hypothetical protein MJE68_09075 [Proteobacteria bacterium]|nr:hypothetical protein [Pseudomonadota bacterium]